MKKEIEQIKKELTEIESKYNLSFEQNKMYYYCWNDLISELNRLSYKHKKENTWGCYEDLLNYITKFSCDLISKGIDKLNKGDFK